MNNLNLPNGVTYCKKCTISNQRPNTSVEYKSVSATANKSYMNLNDDGVCDACKFAETKININWEARKQELEEVLVNHRKTNGEYDVLVPGSGGKDSLMAAKILKDDFNMNPLLV